MLTYADDPTIRNAILKRLDLEAGVEICDILIVPHILGVQPEKLAEVVQRTPYEAYAGDIEYIAVGILCRLGSSLVVRSRFDLPPSFSHQHLLNEIDEIAEQYKAARLDFWGRGAVMRQPEKQLAGTGLRGRWASYG